MFGLKTLEVVDLYGMPCDTFQCGCGTCEGWLAYWKTGNVPNPDDLPGYTEDERDSPDHPDARYYAQCITEINAIRDVLTGLTNCVHRPKG